MGALGWTPNTVMREATVDDLLDAYEGYTWVNSAHEQEKQLPSAEFLQKMLKDFPDN